MLGCGGTDFSNRYGLGGECAGGFIVEDFELPTFQGLPCSDASSVVGPLIFRNYHLLRMQGWYIALNLRTIIRDTQNLKAKPDIRYPRGLSWDPEKSIQECRVL